MYRIWICKFDQTMKIDDAIRFINNSIFKSKIPEKWVDLGCGTGIFTYALATFLAPGSKIIAIDKQFQNLANHYDDVSIEFLKKDFSNEQIPLQGIDGVLIANALHYVNDPHSFLKEICYSIGYFCPFIVIEYESVEANKWVPYPIDFELLQSIFISIGYPLVHKVRVRNSAFGRGKMYLATAFSDDKKNAS